MASLKRLQTGFVFAFLVLGLFISTQASAQDHRAVVVGTAGGATIGHADSEQGNAPIIGGGVGFHLTPRLVVEGDVHGARVTTVFGDRDHQFSQVTFTGSLLFRSSPRERVHFLLGGGYAAQRAHVEFTHEIVGRVDRKETIRLIHGRTGAEWELTSRAILRTEAVLWFGEGLDWVAGGRVGLGYRF